MRPLALGLLLLGLAAAPASSFEIGPFVSPPVDHPLVGRIVDRAGRTVTPEALADAVRGADDLVLGETHTNPDHHRLQAALLKERAAAGDKPAVVFEMIPEGLQGALDAYLAGGGDAAGLGPAMQWAERGWPDPAIYRPIFEAALAAGLPMRAGDLDRETVRAISKAGPEALGPERLKRFGLDRPLPEAERADLAKLLEASHCGLLPAKAIPAMITVQRARDGALADAMVRAGPAAILIAGAGHARRDRAVPALVAAAKPGANIVSVGLLEVEAGENAATDYEIGLYDFSVFTPRFDMSDPCEGMKGGEGMKGSEGMKAGAGVTAPAK